MDKPEQCNAEKYKTGTRGDSDHRSRCSLAKIGCLTRKGDLAEFPGMQIAAVEIAYARQHPATDLSDDESEALRDGARCSRPAGYACALAQVEVPVQAVPEDQPTSELV